MEEQDLEVIHEFLVESYENLAKLDQELVALESRPNDKSLLAGIFRTFHTIKGTCGFLGFATLEKVTHQAENLLSQLRDGQRELTSSLVTLILETVDSVRRILSAIEAGGAEGGETFEPLIEKLRAAAQKGNEPLPPAAPAAAQTCPENVSDEDGPKSGSISDSNVRVGVEVLDKLMDLVGELVLARNQILQYNSEREEPVLNATSQRLNLITSELQSGVMKTRMQPIGVVWNKLPRVVRDTAVALGKQIRVEMDGAETELDRTIIEAIKDPLVHLVRNACDHGIERPEVRVRVGKAVQGTLSLRAYHEGGQVNIEIADDGAGIDAARLRQKAVDKGLLRPEESGRLSEKEALHLIFRPGFSTVEAVTNISGRGVGMDVVKSHIEKVGGAVDVVSQPGKGCAIRLKIPLTLAIIPGLVVGSGGERFVIPQVSLLELIRLEGDRRLENVNGTPVCRRRGSLLPVASLSDVLGLAGTAPAEAVNMVVLQAEDQQFGLLVDAIGDSQEIVVKPLGKQLKGLSVYAGATIMGDGRVALILDVRGIGQCSGVLADSRQQARGSREPQSRVESERRRLLLFRAGSFERLALPLSVVSRLEEFPRSSIEKAGGRHVVQYRGEILRLVPLGAVLEGTRPDIEIADPAPVVVVKDGARSVGLLVDEILDVAEEAVIARQKTTRKGLLGSAVVGTQVADFLDLNFVIRAAVEDWFDDVGKTPTPARILLAEGSGFSRGLIRGGLDMAGYTVLEASNFEEALRRLEEQPVDIALVAADLPPHGASALLDAVGARTEWHAIRVLTLAAGSETGLPDGLAKFDGDGVLKSVASLAAAIACDFQTPQHTTTGGRP
ncbi:MAG TPA: chemotaxis protein CheW [Bryobacteraceae bacterium]|nr:chemotaxis protein CheW [Bryobacteraceae bacterium]